MSNAVLYRTYTATELHCNALWAAQYIHSNCTSLYCTLKYMQYSANAELWFPCIKSQDVHCDGHWLLHCTVQCRAVQCSVYMHNLLYCTALHHMGCSAVLCSAVERAAHTLDRGDYFRHGAHPTFANTVCPHGDLDVGPSEAGHRSSKYRLVIIRYNLVYISTEPISIQTQS